MAIGAFALLVAGQLSAAPADAAVVPRLAPVGAASFVDLGSAATYSILGGTGVANTGAGTVLAGDLGLSPSGVIAGFPPGVFHGVLHDKDTAAETAQADRDAAYADALAQPSTTTFTGDQGGQTFHPGVHTTAAAFTNTGTVTLDADGDSSAVFVFQVGAAFSSAAASKVVLTDGALANNVFWQVTGAVSLGAGAKLVGTFLGAGAITFGDGASIKGRALTPGAVAVTNSPFTEPIDDLTAPVVSIDGGATRSTNDTTPSISGTTDEPAGKTVTVTVGGQTLSGTVGAAGAWSVTAGALAPGTHLVVASITDASQNTGTASQSLTVDVSAPAIAIDGGPTAATHDRTPLISGTTDEPDGTQVTVAVAGQTLVTAAAAGHWSVEPTTLSEASHNVVATVEDAAHNTGTASQVLTVDVTVPVVTIDGGAVDATDDTSPWIYGTTAEQAGTTVHVSIGGQELTATVAPGGTWGVSAQALPKGTYTVVATVTDAAQNTGTAQQELTIGSVVVAPVYQPDAAVRVLGGSYVGTGIYDGSDQRVAKRLRGHARSATFEVRVTNQGDSTDRVEVLGTPRNRAFKVTYTVDGRDVTGEVTAGTWDSAALAPGASVRLVVTVSRTKAADRGDARDFDVRARSTHSPTTRDTVTAAVRFGA